MKDNKYNYNSHSGRFNKRISLYAPTYEFDEIGNDIETFTKLCDCWSMVKTLKGSERYSAGQQQAEEQTRFILRYSKALETILSTHTTRLELHYKGRVYDVKSIINDDEMNVTFTVIAEGRE